MTSGSGENNLGNSRGIDTPMDPIINPLSAPKISSDFNSDRACLIWSTFSEHHLRTEIKQSHKLWQGTYLRNIYSWTKWFLKSIHPPHTVYRNRGKRQSKHILPPSTIGYWISGSLPFQGHIIITLPERNLHQFNQLTGFGFEIQKRRAKEGCHQILFIDCSKSHSHGTGWREQ